MEMKFLPPASEATEPAEQSDSESWPKPGTHLNEWGWRKGTPGMNYTSTERQCQLVEIGRRVALCQSHVRISRDLGLKRETVIKRVRQIEALWREAVVESRERMLAKEGARLEALYQEVMQAWERSTQDAETRSTSKSFPTVGGTAGAAENNASITTRGQYGDSSLVFAAVRIIETKAKLFGLNAPDMIGISWMETVDQALTEARRRAQEERLQLGPAN
jgi:hypothetical protein